MQGTMLRADRCIENKEERRIKDSRVVYNWKSGKRISQGTKRSYYVSSTWEDFNGPKELKPNPIQVRDFAPKFFFQKKQALTYMCLHLPYYYIYHQRKGGYNYIHKGGKFLWSILGVRLLCSKIFVMGSAYGEQL